MSVTLEALRGPDGAKRLVKTAIKFVICDNGHMRRYGECKPLARRPNGYVHRECPVCNGVMKWAPLTEQQEMLLYDPSEFER